MNDLVSNSASEIVSMYADIFMYIYFQPNLAVATSFFIQHSFAFVPPGKKLAMARYESTSLQQVETVMFAMLNMAQSYPKRRLITNRGFQQTKTYNQLNLSIVGAFRIQSLL